MQAAKQVEQLALAIDPERLLVIIAVTEPPAQSQATRSLAQGAEWLAANAGCRVVLVLPRALEHRAELDHVSYTSCSFDAELEPATDSEPPPHADTPVPARLRATPSPSPSAPELGTSPILGRPAPSSDAEKQLFAHLQRDPELAPLFGYNVRVQTRFETTPIVDVLWAEGKLAIEIDGNEHRGALRPSKEESADQRDCLRGLIT